MAVKARQNRNPMMSKSLRFIALPIETANVVFFEKTATISEKWIIFGYLDAFLWADSQK
jgi:hypothetical protein